MDPALEAQAAIDPDIVAQLNNADASSLLDTIDSLREIGVSSFVDLPQIIVVGDQSSGKSSVLEAISRVRFPIDGRLCTRFATELVLRRAPTSETISNVSIQFADSGDAGRLPFKRTTFDKEKLPDLIKEAREVMGIRDSGAKQFSKDILRIEVTGPDVPPITLVDLPGIFQSETANQDARGRDIVNQLVESYMAQSKSIILIVLAANSQLANQGVLDKAREHDPKRERTIGVITKPDRVDRGSSDEREYLDLVKGREAMHKLALGWYVLRNPSEEERSSETNERDAAEKTFFRAGGWSSLDPAHRGAESLRKRLSKVLLDHVKKSLPELIANIDHKLRDRKQELDRLGKSRSTADELRSYLLGITEKFRGLAHDAIEGRYSRANEFFGDLDQEDTRQRKLRAVLRNAHDAFEVVMETKGARYKIGWSEDDKEGQENDEDNHGVDDEDEDDVDDGSGYSDSLDAIPDHLQLLVDGYDAQQPKWKPVEELHAELDAPNNRGNEFPGEVNPELGFLLFKRQTAPWQHISQQHLDKVLDATKVFVEEAFTYIVGPDDATLRAILGLHADKFFDEKKAELQAKLQELLRPYSDGYGLLLERKAHEKMYQTTSRRLGSRVAARLESKHPDLFGDDPRGGLIRDTIVSAICGPEAPGRKTSGIEKVIDMMTVRYELSLGTFTENVVNLAVESCLIHHIPTILTTGKVYDMSFDELKELASESEEVQKRRVDLEAEVKILEEGLRKCQRQKPRPLTQLQRGVPLLHGARSSQMSSRDKNLVQGHRSTVLSGPRTINSSSSHTPVGDATPSPARRNEIAPLPQPTSLPSRVDSSTSGIGTINTSRSPTPAREATPSAAPRDKIAPLPQPTSLPSRVGFSTSSTGFGDNFGSTTNTATPFGGTTSLSGNTKPATTAFGSGTAFGGATGGGLFGACTTTDTTAFSSLANAGIRTDLGEPPGTVFIPFTNVVEEERNRIQSNSLQNISCMDAYKKWSAFELRLADYNQGWKTSSAGGYGGFGTTNSTGFAATTGIGGFGSTQLATSGFDAFITATNSRFGSGGGLFGNKKSATAAPFGSAITTQSAQTGGLSSTNTATTGGFGTGGLFGTAAAVPKPAASNSGNTAAATGNGTGASGTTTATRGFGTTTATTGTGGGLFRSAAPTNTTGSGLFGGQTQ